MGKFEIFVIVKWEEKNNNLSFDSWDSLTIYDGGSSTSPMMGKYCGDSIPPSHVSSSNDILIHFQSDGSATRAGFKMDYNPLGKAHQFKTTLNIMRIMIEKYGTFLFLNVLASINIFFNNNV